MSAPPRHAGRPVPWAALRAGEHPDPHGAIAVTATGVRFSDEKPSDRAFGVLWMRWTSTGRGAPKFAHLHPIRQRNAINPARPRCHVCGQPAADSDGLVPFVAPADRDVETLRTATPPVCDGCLDVSLGACPHLTAQRSALARAWCTDLAPSAVLGHLVRDVRVLAQPPDVLELADARTRPFIVARQLFVEARIVRRTPLTTAASPTP